MSDPIVSVIIPVRNGAAYLSEAVTSVLDQSYAHVEVVVVDDGSEDASGEVAARFGSEIVYERQPPVGIAAARNRGVEVSSGQMLACLDADDVFEPGRLERQVAALLGDPSLEAVFGKVTEFVDPGLPDEVRRTMRPTREAFPSHMVWAMLIRRPAFDRIGPFSTSIEVEAVEWYSRALDAGLRGEMVDTVVLRRRLHGRNAGLRSRDVAKDYVRVARAALERRRAAS